MKIGRTLLIMATFAFGLTLSACKSCVEQHDPRPVQSQINEEADRANAPIEKLNADGTAPAPVAEAVVASGGGGAQNSGVQKYEQFCVACHGADGQANSPSAVAMNPRPRNLTDAKWQASVDDAHIAKVIKEGGAAVGLSPTMAPWGAVLNDEEIQQIVAHVRSFKK